MYTTPTPQALLDPVVTPAEPGGIDLMTPEQACRRLGLDDIGLLALVNRGRLPAFDLAGNIRFRAVDVVSALTGRPAARSAA